MRCAIKESLYDRIPDTPSFREDKTDKPSIPFGAEGRVKVAVFVIGLVLLFVGLAGAAYGWFIASSLETTHAFTCGAGGPGEPYPGFCAALLSSASSYRTFAFGMVALFLIGVVLSVGGAIMKEGPSAPTMMMAPPPIPPPGASALQACKNCARSIPPSDRFCPTCGTAQW